jgi:hypothetical protein
MSPAAPQGTGCSPHALHTTVRARRTPVREVCGSSGGPVFFALPPTKQSLARRMVSSVTLALQPLAQQLTVPPNRFGPFSRPPLRGFLVITAELHFSEYPFALHFFLQGSERLIDIIVANEDLHGGLSPYMSVHHTGPRRHRPAALFSTHTAYCEAGVSAQAEPTLYRDP